MLNVLITDPPRADLAETGKLAEYGTATVHEAIGRRGCLGPSIRPVQQGTRISGTALTVVCWPGDNLMLHVAVDQATASSDVASGSHFWCRSTSGESNAIGQRYYCVGPLNEKCHRCFALLRNK